jgi:putative FmdB family regulatory protein
MPAYDYQCEDCGAPFTLRMSISAYKAGIHATCPNCGSSQTARRIGAVSYLGGRGSGGADGSAGCGSRGFT